MYGAKCQYLQHPWSGVAVIKMPRRDAGHTWKFDGRLISSWSWSLSSAGPDNEDAFLSSESRSPRLMAFMRKPHMWKQTPFVPFLKKKTVVYLNVYLFLKFVCCAWKSVWFVVSLMFVRLRIALFPPDVSFNVFVFFLLSQIILL